MLVKMGSSSPRFGVKIKNVSNHRPVIMFQEETRKKTSPFRNDQLSLDGGRSEGGISTPGTSIEGKYLAR